ncbi:MAG: hypothetical protein L0H41_15510, partial [Microlunatus sp.]|nr:hypothetical protein [Microlunatus sp.]
PSRGLVQGLNQGGSGPSDPNAAAYGGSGFGTGGQRSTGAYPPGQQSAYAGYPAAPPRRSPVGWWIAAAALLLVIVVIGVVAVRALAGGSGLTGGPGPGSQPSQDICPTSSTAPESAPPDPVDGRVHGGPVSYPRLGPPWSAPQTDDRVPFGTDVRKQQVTDQENYDGAGNGWVASVLVAELMAGDGFYTPEQGAQIVVRCILGEFYGDNSVTSDVQVNEARTIDGHDAWVVESELAFAIPGLIATSELLIVAIVSVDETAGLFYASIPNTKPELVKPARTALADLTVDG